MTDDNRPAPAGGASRPVRFSAAVARRVCARLASGETQVSICADPAMPSRSTLFRWVRDLPAFARAFGRARAASGWTARNGPPSSYCPATAAEIYARMCEGETVLAICRDPAMPCFSTVYHWRRSFPEFAEMMRIAREVQAERLCDRGLEMAEAVTPETAFATRVALEQVRWTAAVLAPRRYKVKPQEPEEPPKEKRMLIRRFKVEEDPHTGEMKLVTYLPDPDTGQVRRVGPDWCPPRDPDTIILPA